VTLVEGSVTASRQGGDPLSLKPSEQLFLGDTSVQIRTLSPSELDNTLSWRSGRLVLDGLTLSQAVARFASYHGKQIQVNPDVAALHVGGSCPLDDLAGFLEYLKSAFPVQVVENADGSDLITAR
jgi:transmembrane sensor